MNTAQLLTGPDVCAVTTVTPTTAMRQRKVTFWNMLSECCKGGIYMFTCGIERLLPPSLSRLLIILRQLSMTVCQYNKKHLLRWEWTAWWSVRYPVYFLRLTLLWSGCLTLLRVGEGRGAKAFFVFFVVVIF